MRYRSTLRGTARLRRVTATSVVIAVGAGLCTVAAPSAVAASGPTTARAGGQEAVLPPAVRVQPRQALLVEAGPTSFKYNLEGTGGDLWTDYATGETRTITEVRPGRGFDGLRAYQAPKPEADGSQPVSITDIVTGRVTSLTPHQGDLWSGVYTADSIVGYEKETDGVIRALRMVRKVDGMTEVKPITGVPEGATSIRALADKQDARGALVRFTKPDGTAVHTYLDRATARLIPLPEPFDWDTVIGGNHLLAYPGTGGKVFTLDRRDLTAAPVSTPVPAPTLPEQYIPRFAVVGDWIVVGRGDDPAVPGITPGGRLLTLPIGGGTVRELLPHVFPRFAQAPDGSVLTAAGTSAADWAVRRISPGTDGAPKLTTIREVPPVPVDVEALAIGGGKLGYLNRTVHSDPRGLTDHDVSVTGAPSVGPGTLRWQIPTEEPTELHSLGNGRHAFTAGTSVYVPISTNEFESFSVPGPTIVDAAGRYVVINSTDGKQYVGDIERGRDNGIALTRARTAAAVWGTTLWFPGKASGTVAWQDVKSAKKSADFAIGSGCVPNTLQAVGRWIYWGCATGKAGVWDQKTRKSTPVPSGKARLGDGYLVRQDGGKLLLTDFHQGTGTATTSDFAEVPEGGRWGVDKFGGPVVYTDAAHAIHLRRVSVPGTPIGVAASEVDTAVMVSAGSDWKATWQLTRPAAKWSVTFKDAAGRTVRTLTSTERRGASISAVWDGKDATGKPVFGGAHTWTLSADAGDGVGARVVGSGKLDVMGGATPFRDYDGNGVPELLTKQSTDLVAHEQLVKTASAGAARTTSKGWTDANHIVPMGDMTGDRCNDTVVRNAKGELYRYSGVCKGIPTPKSPKTRIGAGFNAFNPPLSAGDLTGDGRTDLLARVRTTNDLYLYADNGTGGLKAGVKLPGSWKGLVLIGAGDLTGDGHGDLLARDAGGELWRYNGTGKGGFTAKALVFKDWGAGRNAFVGAGDLNGDGKNDLVSRDAAGKLLRNLGDGKGSFGGTVQIGTGWQRYLGLY